MSDSAKISPSMAVELLIRSINQGDTGSFYKVAENYRKGLAFGGTNHIRLGQLLNQKPKSMTLLDSMTTSMKGLVAQRETVDENVFLNAEAEAFLQSLFVEWANRDLYSYHNLGVRSKLLLHGPTGNGKTTIARHIARVTDLPLVEVAADSVIDSHLGTTGRNIAKVFDNIKEPCVLFWDEVDSVGRIRGGSSKNTGVEVENDRMVNSILLNMEKLPDDVIFIGATNRRDILDAAFLRRFDVQFEVPNPTREERMRFAQQLSASHNLPFVPELREADVNYSEVKQTVIGAIRQHIAQQVLQNK